MTHLSNYGICYEAIQRVYRNAVVRAARRALQQAFPDDWGQRLKRIYEKTWQQIEEEALERRTTGEIGCDLRDDIDYLGVNHFFNLFEAFFDVLFPSQAGTADRARQQERQAVTAWAKEVRVLRDPMSHPSEDDLPYEDAFRMLDAARRILLKLDPEAANKVWTCVGQLHGGPISDQFARALEGYLPPPESIAVRFVGRSRELHDLWTWFDSPRGRRWALMGDGGKGKTAIAYEFACQAKERASKPFEFVIWLSAKRQQFVEGSVAPIVRPDFSNLDSALRWLLLHYGWGDDVPVEDMRDFCLELLKEFPSLLVVDDVDSLEGVDESAAEFFTVDVPATNSKVLLTSRRNLTGLGATTTVVEGFNDEDGRAFIQSRIHLLGLDPSAFPSAVVRQILEATDRSPLFIEDLLRLCASGVPSVDAIRAWNERDGHEARKYALSREVDLLSDRARKALAACSASEGAVSLAEIQATTGMSDQEATSAIQELQRLFLVPKPRLIESVERFDLNLNTRALVRLLLADTDLFRGVQAGFRALSGDLVSSKQRQYAIGSYIRQAVGLVKQDRHADAEKTLQAGLTAYPNDPALLGQLGWLFKTWKPHPRVTEARESFERAEQLRCADEEMYRHWCEMEAWQREWTKSAQAAEDGLGHIPGSTLLKFSAGYARSRLGRDLIRQLQPRAIDELHKARNHFRGALKPPEELECYRERQVQTRVYRGLALTLESLVELFTGREENGEAERRRAFAREGLAILQLWSREHPDDPYVEREATWLEPIFNAALA